MVKIERLRIELAVLLMISLVAFGGFMSLGISDDGSDSSISDADDGNELTGDWKKPKFIKRIQKEAGRIDDNIKKAIKRESPKPVICAQVITSAKNSQTGECKKFPNACIPAGWNKVSSCPTVTLPVLPPTPAPKPAPTCPQECAGPGSFCHNKRLPACPEGTSHEGPMDAPSKNIKCAHVCMPVAKKACRIDISNCPLALKSNFKSNMISGTPDPRYNANSINGQCLIDKDQITRPFGNQYWKYSAPCGRILQRQ